MAEAAAIAFVRRSFAPAGPSYHRKHPGSSAAGSVAALPVFADRSSADPATAAGFDPGSAVAPAFVDPRFSDPVFVRLFSAPRA